jgi:HAMP domain-containing protein
MRGSALLTKDVQKLIADGIALANSSLGNRRGFLFALYSNDRHFDSLSCFCFSCRNDISKKIGAPIVDLAEAAEKLALGDVNVTVETKLKDEVGDLVSASERWRTISGQRRRGAKSRKET